jgi:hypothetical protein
MCALASTAANSGVLGSSALSGIAGECSHAFTCSRFSSSASRADQLLGEEGLEVRGS